MKKERGSKLQIVVQMIRMERNAGEVDDFLEFWSAVPGVDQVRIKEDETNMLRPDAGHGGEDWKHPCHYLWRGPMYVKQNGDVYACCQSYIMAGGPVGNLEHTSLEEIWNSDEMQRMRRLHVSGRAGEIDVCAKCCTTIPHTALVVGSLLLHGKTVRRLLPVVERLTYLSKLPRALLRPPQAGRPSRGRVGANRDREEVVGRLLRSVALYELRRRRRPCGEADLHHRVLVEAHFAALSDHVAVDRPRQAVVAERHPHISRTLRYRAAHHAEPEPPADRAPADVPVGARAFGPVMPIRVVIRCAAGQHQRNHGGEEPRLRFLRANAALRIHLQGRRTAALGLVEHSLRLQRRRS